LLHLCYAVGLTGTFQEIGRVSGRERASVDPLGRDGSRVFVEVAVALNEARALPLVASAFGLAERDGGTEPCCV
jgi:hypothetical protein